MLDILLSQGVTSKHISALQLFFSKAHHFYVTAPHSMQVWQHSHFLQWTAIIHVHPNLIAVVKSQLKVLVAHKPFFHQSPHFFMGTHYTLYGVTTPCIHCSTRMAHCCLGEPILLPGWSIVLPEWPIGLPEWPIIQLWHCQSTVLTPVVLPIPLFC